MESSRSGGGYTRVIEDGSIFEKGGVNYSSVRSPLTQRLAERLSLTPQSISAAGISLVLHPFSPMIPVVHMNLRHLRLENGDAWFGGGMDLTPFYIFKEDVCHFHQRLKEICDRYDPRWYTQFKQNCDEYFFLKHRQEARGVGGIFFDYQRNNPARLFEFVRELGNNFVEIYSAIVEERRREPWGEREKSWQEYRRGRYVEFNLLYDRGTLFGLETEGRTESILMSLPPKVSWSYDFHPPAGSREEQLINILQQPQSWV